MGKNKRIVSLLLALLMVFNIVIPTVAIAADISGEVKLLEYKITRPDGTENNSFEQGEFTMVNLKLDIHYPAETVAGDTFSVNLPDSEYFNFGDKGSLPANNPLVTYKCEGGKLIFTITEHGASFEGLYDVELTIWGRAEKAGNNIDGGGNGDITLEVTPAPEPKPGENTDMPFPDESKKLFKNGRQQALDSVITWSARLGYQDLGALHDQGIVGGKISNKKGMMLVDHLTPGTSFTPNSLTITVPTYITNTKYQMGDRQIGAGFKPNGSPQENYFADIFIHRYDTHEFQLLEQGTMTYDEFFTYVQDYPENNGQKRAYGIYKHEDKTETLLVAFGDMPGNTNKYSDLRKDYHGRQVDIFQAIDEDVSITQTQKDYMKEIYGPNGPSNGYITAYDIGFAVDVNTPEYGSGIYENKISLVDKGDYEEKTEWETEFIDNSDNINAYGLTITKAIPGEGTINPGKLFFFEIRNENGIPVAFGKTENIFTEMGQESKVLFYKEDSYSTEIKTFKDWKSVLSIGKYTIHEVGVDSEYEAIFMNELTGEETNVFEYKSDVNQRWVFKIDNIEKNTEIEGTKKWVDGNNQDGLRPDKITLKLYKSLNGAAKVFVKDIEVLDNGTDLWTYKVSDLPLKEDGKNIEYSVEEVAVPGYETTVTGFDVTNIHTPGVTKVEGEKVWEDGNDQDGKRPTKVEIQLIKTVDGVETVVETKEVVGDRDTNSWAYEFLNLPTHENGKEITYSVKEIAVPDYTTVITGTTVTNSYTPGVTKVEGEKVWEDGNDQDGKRPTKVEIQLIKTVDGAETVVETKEVVGDRDTNSWAYEFLNLPTHENGKEITYSVKEIAVPDYTTVITGTTVTNSYTPGVTKVEGEKVWEDGNDQDGKRPTKVKIQLIKTVDGIETVVETKEVVGDRDTNSWAYEFLNLPTHENGKEITYSVKEIAVPDYTTVITGTTVTNSYTPGVTKVEGEKVWEDGNDQDGKRPTKVEIQLIKTVDGVETVVETKEVVGDRDTNSWAYEFLNLPTHENGKEITYSVKEIAVPDYTTVITGTTVTNSYTPGVTKVEGEKVWEDGNDQDGKRPTKVEIQLIKTVDGVETVVETKEVVGDRDTNSWAYEFLNLPTHENGKEITYSVKEIAVPDYTTVITGTTVTNSYTPGVTKVEGEKVWEDGNDQDGKRPTKVEIQLIKTVDGVETVVETKEVVGDRDTNSWAYEFLNLPTHENGKEITYSVKEIAVPDYTTVITGTTVTNSYTPGVTKVEGEKVWEDGNDQDGKRPTKVEIQLIKTVDGVETVVETKEVVGDRDTNSWAYEFLNLPTHENGKEITYSVKEIAVPDYTTVITGTTVTNSYTPGVTKVEGEKVWEDGNDQDGKRPTKVEIQLIKTVDGVETVVETKEVVGDRDTNSWAYEFLNLPTHENGKEITYSVKEIAVPDYTTVITGTTVTNSYTPGVTKVEGEKVWEDGNDQDGKRPTKVEIQLIKTVDGVETVVETKEVVGDRDTNSWAYEFLNLPTHENGKEITYSVKEIAVPDYTTVITGTTVTNSYTPGVTKVEGEKVWEDGNDQDGKRPTKVEIQLIKTVDGAETVVETKEVVGDRDTNSWAYEFLNLPTHENGKEITYSVKEIAVPDYTTVITGTTVTNSYTPGVTKVEGNKVWEDGNDQDGKRPASIKINLLADGTVIDTKTVTEADGWAWDFTNLPTHKAGTEIVYTITEEVVPDYTTVITGNDVTNSYTPGVTNVAGTKTWDDANNQDGKRPVSIKINLLADGTVIDTKTVTEADGWAWDFTNLPTHKAGTEIVYTITEEVVPDYTTVITGNDVTNSYTPGVTNVAGTKTWDDANNQDGKRPASITINLLADGTVIDTKTVTEADGWAWDFTNLPTHANGAEIVYTITEETVDYYVTEITGFDITNTYISSTEIEVAKELQGRKLKAYEFAFAIEGSDKAQGYYEEIENDKLGKADFSKLEFKEVGTYSYKITEINTGDRKIKYDETVYNLTIEVTTTGKSVELTKTIDGNTEVIPVSEDSIIKVGFVNKTGSAIIEGDKNKEEVAVSGSITWNDDNNKNKERPDKVNVILYADGKMVSSVDITETENWRYNFKKLPKTNADKTTIVYTVDVEDIPNYKIDKSGFDIIIRYSEGINSGKSMGNVINPQNDNALENLEMEEEEIVGVNTSELSKPGFLLKFLVNGIFTEDEILDKSTNWEYEWNNNELDATDMEIVYNNSKELDDQKEVVVILKENGVEVDRKIITKAEGWKYVFKELKTDLEVDSIMYSIEFEEK